MASVVSICNEALAEISADAIESLDESSVSANRCAAAFDDVLSDLLARHAWEFNRLRITASPVTNDRARDWSFAYAKPAGSARVLAVVQPVTTSYPQFGEYSGPYLDQLGAVPFTEVGDTIYCNVANAILEYSGATVEIARIPPLFRRAVAMELASRVAMPIKRDRAIKGDMVQQAELAFQRAVAEDENRNPRQMPDYISEAEKARAGGW